MNRLRGNRAVSYCRVSSNKDKQKTSIESQKAFYQEKFSKGGLQAAPVGMICNSRGQVTHTTNGIYADEGISGTSLKHRKAFNLMIEDAKKGKFDVIYVKSVSRFARSAIDGKQAIEDLRALGVGVVIEELNINTISASNDFTIGVLFEVAEEESRSKSYNVKWGIKRRIESGMYLNSIPLGYKREGSKIWIDPKGAEIIQFIFNEYTENGNSLLGIANKLMEKGYQTYTGNDRWRITSIKRILQNELYKGLLRQGKTESTTFKDGGKRAATDEDKTIVRSFPELAIIDPDQWERAQDILQERSFHREGHTDRFSSAHTFSSLVFCDTCGGAYTRRLNNRSQIKKAEKEGKKIKAYYQWCCCEHDLHGDRVCKKKVRNSISEIQLEKAVREEIQRLQKDTEYLKKLFMVHELIEHGFPVETSEIEALGKRKEELTAQLMKLISRANMNDLNSSIYDDMISELEDELRGIKHRITQINYREDYIQEDKKAFDSYLKDLREFDTEDLTQVSLKRIFNKIWVIDLQDYFPEEELNGYRRGLVFDFKFFKMSYMELIEKAADLGYPDPLKLDVMIV